jgi:hypothetical protein
MVSKGFVTERVRPAHALGVAARAHAGRHHIWVVTIWVPELKFLQAGLGIAVRKNGQR